MALVIDSISKRFGDVQALDGVSLRVEPGQVFGFLGANGAGKTTAMRIVLDILRADQGSVSWLGRPNTAVPRRTWGYLPEERGLYARMKVLEQLVFFAELQGVPPRHARRETFEWLERFRIPEYAERRAEELSKGNQQKIQFIAAILHDPDVLLMDEPFSGLDPVNVALLKEAFFEMQRRGKTLLFSTHQMETVEELCQSIAILDRGLVVVSGSVREVRAASGRRMVRLAVEGDPELDWLDVMEGVRVTRHGQDYTEAEVDRSRDPESILQAALGRGARVTHFEIADPSLEQIFIEHVGAIDRSERTLAAPRAAGAAA
ncbi:MAG: ABC transporter ATP-binding protein [Candidatus Limnocylindrales bacterium]